MKKIEVHLFSDGTESEKKHSISVWRIFWIAIGIVAAVAGFALFSPIQLTNLIFDRQIVKVYQENRLMKQEIREAETKLNKAKETLQETNALRDSLFSEKSMKHILNVPKGDAPLVSAKENLSEAKDRIDSMISILKDNPKLAHALPIIYPLKGNHTVTNRYQMLYDAFTEQPLPHEGIDFSAVAGDTVFATGNGTVLEQRTHRGFGITLKIEHTEHLRTFYAHLQSTLVPAGKFVKRGEPIAIVGNSGRATGTVLHYEIRYDGEPINPENYFIFKGPSL